MKTARPNSNLGMQGAKSYRPSTYSAKGDSLPFGPTADIFSTPEVRARERVRKLAEVFTAKREVDAMLDLIPDRVSDIRSRFLEPSCGNGNFLCAILYKKLGVVIQKYKEQNSYEFHSLIALASIYGVDIESRNIKDARERMRALMRGAYSQSINTAEQDEGYWSAVNYILKKNIIRGDMINGVEKIKLTEFISRRQYRFEQRVFRLSDLIASENFDLVQLSSVQEIPTKEYWELGEK